MKPPARTGLPRVSTTLKPTPSTRSGLNRPARLPPDGPEPPRFSIPEILAPVTPDAPGSVVQTAYRRLRALGLTGTQANETLREHRRNFGVSTTASRNSRTRVAPATSLSALPSPRFDRPGGGEFPGQLQRFPNPNANLYSVQPPSFPPSSPPPRLTLAERASPVGPAIQRMPEVPDWMDWATTRSPYPDLPIFPDWQRT